MRFGKNLRRLKALQENQQGVAAIEFALLAIPFFALFFAIIQVSVIFIGTTAMENAAMDATRLIRTGQSVNQSNFKQQVCANIPAILQNCTQNLRIIVSTAANFQNIDINRPDDAGTLNEGFDGGLENEIIVVQAVYNLPNYVPRLLPMFSSNGNDTFVLMATNVFRNEPYDITN